MTVHASEQAEARYGLSLSARDLEKIIRDIEAGRGHWVKSGRCGVEVYDLSVRAKIMRVAVALDQGVVLTVLPRDRPHNDPHRNSQEQERREQAFQRRCDDRRRYRRKRMKQRHAKADRSHGG